jgi:succinate dehydrogenase / fumarate reductase flavoprotein subunit
VGADAVILATGGYGNVFYLATYCKGPTPPPSGAPTSAARPSPTLLHADPSHLHPGERRAPEQAHAHERVAAQRRADLGAEEEGDKRPPDQIPEDERDYYLERKYPSFGNLVPRDVASRNAKQVCDEGRGVGETGYGVYLDFTDAIKRLGAAVIGEKYGNLFEMYERITAENPYRVPMRIYPATHYTMGGLWVDYNLMTTIPGLHVVGEANFSDHGANRLGGQRADAGPGRRLLRRPLHHRPLPSPPPRWARWTPAMWPSSRWKARWRRG